MSGCRRGSWDRFINAAFPKTVDCLDGANIPAPDRKSQIEKNSTACRRKMVYSINFFVTACILRKRALQVGASQLALREPSRTAITIN
jgi:hypothetical protein